MNWMNMLSAVVVHLKITFLGVVIGAIIGLPLSALLVRMPRLARFVFPVVDAIQTVPTLAMLTFVMLLLGLNDRTVITAIALYTLFPITRNSYTGLMSVETGVLRAGHGVGMTPLQVFLKVRFPIAVPMILTGLRLAVVSALGIAATGVFIGAGGLGMLIWRGIQTRNTAMMLSGAIPVSLLAVLFETLMGRLEKRLVHYK